MITYKLNASLDIHDVIQVYRSSGIQRPIDDIPRMQKIFQESNCVVSAWANQRLIGIARTLTDFVYVAYLADLAVAAEYQKQGIGKSLIQTTRATLGDGVTLLLLSAPSAMAYYPKVDFQSAPNAFIIHRQQ